MQELEKLEKIKDRDLHAVVSERYFKLWEAESIEEFKRAFLDCLECHYHAYHTGRVLHRDISENNLMIWRPIKERSTESLGILNDFDMAAEVGDDGELLANSARRRTGTLPFIARDLLAPIPKGGPSPKHLYRHDLESFFYVLIWAAAHYEFGTKTRHPTSEVLKKWDEEDRSHVFKCVFMTNIAYYRDLRSLARPENHDLCLEWIEPLHKLFFRAQLDMMTHDLHGKPFDYDTYNGKITFANFMAAIGETPRGFEPDSYQFL
ncbi:hypothetical protein GALMADRAFT_1350349 [Galerina marginata CBS 339.88]|uniref:Protein kinase domain-containing protein n=1 Tax=Galerina marginata (strain CBS 339.88) TaxID=685588 RepID=A0A067SHV4_GALM3|nr:hypothetical protein GALMADRAFT_1350349 [Galerina marginata CBS 339.88]